MDSPNLLNRVKDLNARISHLSVNTGQSGKAAAAPRLVSLDFIHSDNLEEIEKGIRETVSGVVMSRAAVCKSLANIDKKRLYVQAGHGSFLQYLKAQRIPIKYKTAKEYAKIGDTLMRYEENLKNVCFNEEEGLKKLIFLDKALRNHAEEAEQVFKKVTESSLREFQRYAEYVGDQQEETVPAVEIQGLSLFRRLDNGEQVEILRITDPELTGSSDDENIETYVKSLKKAAEAYLKFRRL